MFQTYNSSKYGSGVITLPKNPHAGVLSRSHRRTNKFSPGNSKHFTGKQLKALDEANR